MDTLWCSSNSRPCVSLFYSVQSPSGYQQKHWISKIYRLTSFHRVRWGFQLLWLWKCFHERLVPFLIWHSGPSISFSTAGSPHEEPRPPQELFATHLASVHFPALSIPSRRRKKVIIIRKLLTYLFGIEFHLMRWGREWTFEIVES